MSSVGLGTSLLQKRDGMWFTRNETPTNATLWPKVFVSKSLTSAETHYSNIDREALGGILNRLENFHQNCYTCEVSMINDHNVLGQYLRNMLQAYHTNCREYYYGYTSKTSEFYKSELFNADMLSG